MPGRRFGWGAEVTLIAVTRRTLAQPAELKGLGLHSGVPVEVSLNPAAEGVRFLYGDECVVAKPESVTDTTRSTSLGGVRTVEHLMSALSGLGITDLDVRLSAPELPAMDGSAGPFCEALDNGGTVELGVRHFTFPDEGMLFDEGPVSIKISPGSGRWQYGYESAELWPFQRVVDVDLRASDYRQSVARARTFLREKDLASLDGGGLARGIDRSRALIIGTDSCVTAERLEDELVTHKILDLIGDLYLTGIPAGFLDVQARRCGHRANVAAARQWTSMQDSSRRAAIQSIDG